MSLAPTLYDFRFGIDLGGTKIEIVALGPDGGVQPPAPHATPSGYDATIEGIAGLVRAGRAGAGRRAAASASAFPA